MTTLDVLPMVVPADHVLGPPQGRWTTAAYAALPDDGRRYEVIGGVLYIAPAPTLGHQASNLRFARYLMQYVEDTGLGRVFPAPIDVPDVVLQPDMVVVLNANLGILTPERIVGAPDLVVEIASPGTAGYDRRQKQDAYARAGVAEYWIADPLARTVEVLRLSGDAYRSLGVFNGQAQLPSAVAPGLPVQVQRFFA